MTTTIYGIKNCDTVKKALKWLEANEVSHTFHDLRKDGLAASTVTNWLSHIPLETLINKRSTTWKQLNDTEKASLSETTAPALCVNNPTLIKRPVTLHNDKMMVGFKEASYKDFFNL